MARFSTRQHSFSNGRVSPSVWGRSDMEFYYTALAMLKNRIPDQFGGLHRRPGTRFLSKAKGKPCYYPFMAAADCPVQIAATPECFEFFLDGEVFEGQLDTPYTEDDYCDLQTVEDCGAMFIVHPNYPPQFIKKTEAGFQFEALISSPYAEQNSDENCKLCLRGGVSTTGGQSVTFSTGQVCALGDVLTAANGTTFTITSVDGAGAYTADAAPVGIAGSYTIEDKNADDLVAAGTTFTIDVSGSQATLDAQGCAPFTADMVGQSILILDEEGVDENEPNTWVTVRILAYNSDGSVVVDYGGTALKCTDLFRLPLFADGKYPSAVWIHSDRLWYAVGNCVAGSAPGNFDDWQPFDADGTVNPDNAIYTKISAGECSEIKWMRSNGRQLVIGTDTNIQSLFGAGVGGSFQADAFGQQLVEDIGTSCVPPVTVGPDLLFIDASCQRIHTVQQGGQYDQLALSDLTIFQDDIGERRFKSMSYQRVPFPIVWVTTEDGCLFSITYWPSQSVRGWAEHEFGGQHIVNGCCEKPKVCDVGVQRSADQKSDHVTFAVQRTINGEDVIFHERLGEFFRHRAKEEDAHYLDAALPLEPGADLPSVSVGKSGPVSEAWAALPQGRFAICDDDAWFYGQNDGGIVTMDYPNTIKPEAGRTWVQVSDDWVFIDKPCYGEKQAFYGSECCFWRSPCSVKAVCVEVDGIKGLECLEGEDVVAYLDGQDCGKFTVQDGGIDAKGCVGWVGFPFTSEFAPLPFRQNLGTTDGAADYAKTVEVSLNVYRTPHVEIGLYEADEYRQCSERFSMADMPENTDFRGPTFHSCWVTAMPQAKLTRNDKPPFVVRDYHPFPSTILGMETTTYASGGR